MSLITESNEKRQWTTLAFFGGSEYSLRVLLAILRLGTTRLAFLISERVATESSAWRDLRDEVKDIEQRLVPAESTDVERLVGILTRDPIDIGLSVNFMRRLTPDVINVFSLGCLNLHPSFLPHNRGTWPELWSIIEGTPAGATLHYMDSNLDTGDILDQTQVEVYSYDTGESLCAKIDEAGLALMIKNWPQVSRVRAQGSPQLVTMKLRKDAERIAVESLDLSHVGSLKEHLNLLRALTLRPFISGGWYIDTKTGMRVQVQVQFEVYISSHKPNSTGETA